jgi:hypothetical protein
MIFTICSSISMPKPSLSGRDSEYAAHQKAISRAKVVQLKREYACACVFRKQILNDPFWFADGIGASGQPLIGIGLANCWDELNVCIHESDDWVEEDMQNNISVPLLTRTMQPLYKLEEEIARSLIYLKVPKEFKPHTTLMTMHKRIECKLDWHNEMIKSTNLFEDLIDQCSPLPNRGEWMLIVEKAQDRLENLILASEQYNTAVQELMRTSFAEIIKYEKIIDVAKIIEDEPDIMPYLDIPPEDVVLPLEDDLEMRLRRVRNAVAGDGTDNEWSDEDHEEHTLTPMGQLYL